MNHKAHQHRITKCSCGWAIVRSNRLFYWYVDPDIDAEGIIQLHIVSEDKKLIVTYEVGQHSIKKKPPYIVIIGEEFEGWTAEYIDTEEY